MSLSVHRVSTGQCTGKSRDVSAARRVLHGRSLSGMAGWRHEDPWSRARNASARPGRYAESRPLTVTELELAPPGDGELLVRIEAAGLCHSDLSVVDGNRVRPVPMLLGHEAAGVVEQVGARRRDLARRPTRGDDVPAAVRRVHGLRHRRAGTVHPGQRRQRCGHPARRRTRSGSPTAAGAAPSRVSRRSPPTPWSTGVRSCRWTRDVPPVVASLLGCAVLTGGGAVLNAGQPQPGQTRWRSSAWAGSAWPRMLTALAHDDVRVIAVDQVPDKLARARELGAHDAVHAGAGGDLKARRW